MPKITETPTAEAAMEDAVESMPNMYDLPKEVEDQIPQWKQRYGKVYKIELSNSTYLYRPLMWKELKEISRRLQTFSNSPNATEASLTMLELELVLETTVLYPPISSGAVEGIPAGDLETLQRLINEASGWTQMPPLPEEL